MKYSKFYITTFFVLVCVILLGTIYWRTNNYHIYTYCDSHRSRVDSLLDNVYTHQDIESFEELMCGCYKDFPVSKLCNYMGDSAHYVLSYNHMIWLTDGNPENYLYYVIKCFACGEFANCMEIPAELPLQPILSNWFEISWHLGNPSEDSYSYKLYAREVNEMDSLVSRIRTECDTLDYLKLRQIATADQLISISKFLADSVSYPLAIQDTYLCYLMKYGNPIMMDSILFEEAYKYLQKGVRLNYLPSIWSKACLLLAGSYLPQDTFLGKELFERCLLTPHPLPARGALSDSIWFEQWN